MKSLVWLGLAAALLATTAARAGAQLETTRSTCTVSNCAGMTIRGVVQGNEPFVVQVYAREGECLRLDVSEQTEDLSMHFFGPFFQSAASSGDDRPGDTRPFLAYGGLPHTGWYTVIVQLRDPANVDARFKLEYGRYNNGNVNCDEI